MRTRNAVHREAREFPRYHQRSKFHHSLE
jgi:hypothetical protein